jgi:hypothetical protein
VLSKASRHTEQRFEPTSSTKWESHGALTIQWTISQSTRCGTIVPTFSTASICFRLRPVLPDPFEGIRKVYVIAEYAEQRKQMLQWWANYVNSLMNESKVIVGNFRTA